MDEETQSRDELAETGVEVPADAIPPETLTQMIREFILREGTDYGEYEAQLATKIEQVRRQLDRGEAKIVFDLTSETGSIVPVSAKARRA